MSTKTAKVLRVICATVLALGIAMPSTVAFATPDQPVVLEGSEAGGGGGLTANCTGRR
ncbi:MAG: hypothetical protein LBL23_00690 [Coriobacteriales bacterium]|nr:hypothetical protein [Coriobacteriales bacterium]